MIKNVYQRHLPQRSWITVGTHLFLKFKGQWIFLRACEAIADKLFKRRDYELQEYVIGMTARDVRAERIPHCVYCRVTLDKIHRDER